MPGSSIATALPALYTTYSSASVSGLAVILGPVYDAQSNFFLAVGWDRSEEPSVTSETPSAALGGRQVQETCTVSSLLSLAVGSDDPAGVIQTLLNGYNLLDSALAANRTLSGTAELAWNSGLQVTPYLTETGTFMEVTFQTTISALS